MKPLKDVGNDVPDPVVIHEDYQNCTAMLKSNGDDKQTKHIDRRYIL